jgi:hypothetical protein
VMADEWPNFAILDSRWLLWTRPPKVEDQLKISFSKC